jgi:predicted RNA-binding Zn ribbon-like protein
MEALATDRLRMPAGRAPGGLALVQELINTGGITDPNDPARLPDLLGDPETANSWLHAALAQWSTHAGQPAPELHLTEADLAPLLKLRESLRTRAAAANPLTAAAAEDAADPPSGSTPSVSLTLRIDPDGRVGHTTTATGWRGVAALVIAQILLAQHTGSWPRFKTCAFPTCGVAYYDESRNNSRVWHDVRLCGNRANLAAARQRRRNAGPGSDQVAAVQRPHGDSAPRDR